VSRALVFAALLAACVPAASPYAGSEGELAEGTPDAWAVLGLVNSAAATVDLLDAQVGLDKRAAANIVARRPFTTVAELDAVPYVAATALSKLTVYAEAKSLIAANEATLAQLDAGAGLDSRAAANLVAARPLASFAALASVKYVAKTAVEHLAAWAPTFTAPKCYLALADSIDQNAADLSELLVLATTIDAPAYEMVAVHATGCPNVLDSENQPALISALEARINWRYAPGTKLPFVVTALAAGDSGFVNDLHGAQQVINDNVTGGTWVPSSSPTGAALYARLPQLITALTPSSVAGVDQIGIVLDADECSQRIEAIIDVHTLEIRIIHKLSEC
jgi:DNA uptake protein ComE-like DNA-binding protein